MKMLAFAFHAAVSSGERWSVLRISSSAKRRLLRLSNYCDKHSATGLLGFDF